MIHIKHALALVSAVGLGSALAGCAVSGAGPEETLGQSTEAISTDVCPAGVPVALAPAADQTLKSTLTGVGVQIYTCAATPAGGFAWTLVGPQANLLNDEGKLVGTHFIGPTWQGNDGSSVVGAKKAAASVDASAVPWLRLDGVSHSAEDGRFSDVTTIQRLSTVGGLAPAEGCDVAHAGSISQIPYTAQYVFYRTKAEGNVKQCNGS
jgi:hypothetical protein